MGGNKKKVQSKDKNQLDTQAFLEEYKKLCAKHKLQLVANPAYRKRDDGTYSVVVQFSVGKVG